MNIKSILIMLMLIVSIGVVSADTVQVVKTQYPAFIAQFGIGEVLYKTVSNNGDVSYQLSRNRFKPLTIFVSELYYKVSPGSSVTIPITINGCCYAMDGRNFHEHEIFVFDDVTGKLVLQKYPPPMVGSTETNLGTFVIITPPNAVGLYKYKIREMIGLNIGSSTNTVGVSLGLHSSQIIGGRNVKYVDYKYVDYSSGGDNILIQVGDVSKWISLGDTVDFGLGYTVKFKIYYPTSGTASLVIVYTRPAEYILATGNLVSVSIQVGTPVPTYTTPQPTYTTPQPTYTTPQPTYTTPQPTYTTPSPTPTPTPPSGDCPSGSLMIDDKCAKVIPQLPGFEGIFVIIGMFIVFLLRRKT